MMAKTFDNVWDMQALNHQFMFAQNVATWHDAEPCPPPASGLRLVSQMASWKPWEFEHRIKVVGLGGENS